MNSRTFHQIQAIELRRLLDEAEEDPVLGPQLQDRIEDIERTIAEEGEQPPGEALPLSRTAIFLRGGGVLDSDGIRPGLAGEALIQYEKMFTEQALHDERAIARNAGLSRRPRGSSPPGLLFVGTPHGSFGLEFIPQETDNPDLQKVRAQALDTVTDAIVRVTASGPSVHDETIANIPPTVLQPMKQFMKTLVQYGAELRLAYRDSFSQSLSTEQIAAVVERLDREVIEEEVDLIGELRGVTLLTGYFDFVRDDGAVISGTVSEGMTEDQLKHLHDLTNRTCKASFQKTTVRRVSGQEATTYVLLGASDSPQ